MLGRITYSPQLAVPLVCANSACDREFDAFEDVHVLPGHIWTKRQWALLCKDCARLFWQREAELDAQQ